METVKLAEIAGKLKESSSSVPYDKIPEIDLYMDQLTTFFDDRLNGAKRWPDDKILTKTMINNYTKDKLLPPSKNKKYSKEHMALLMLIYHLKLSVTISDVKQMLKAINSSDMKLEMLYACFEKLLQAEDENVLEEALAKIRKAGAENLPENEKQTALLTALALITSANAKKRLAEKIIDEILT